jgi:hypothetical protein
LREECDSISLIFLLRKTVIWVKILGVSKKVVM